MGKNLALSSVYSQAVYDLTSIKNVHVNMLSDIYIYH